VVQEKLQKMSHMTHKVEPIDRCTGAPVDHILQVLQLKGRFFGRQGRVLAPFERRKERVDGEEPGGEGGEVDRMGWRKPSRWGGCAQPSSSVDSATANRTGG
jgi:hypothetical protein